VPVYSRADVLRTATLVVALFLTATSANAFAREFRAAETPSGDYPTFQALRHLGHLIGVSPISVATLTDFDHRPFEAAMAALYETAQRGLAVASLIERIRKAE
jgi:hypothetical protein